MADYTGVLTSSLYTKHGMSTPAFISLMVRMPDGEDFDFFASGKLATSIEKLGVALGTTVAVTADDHQIVALVRRA